MDDGKRDSDPRFLAVDFTSRGIRDSIHRFILACKFLFAEKKI